MNRQDSMRCLPPRAGTQHDQHQIRRPKDVNTHREGQKTTIRTNSEQDKAEVDCAYKIGRVFRNEGIDFTHNPEFTLCEFYMACADMYDLMEVRGNVLKGTAKYLNGGSTIVKYPEGKDHKELVLDFKTAWKRYDMIETVEKRCVTWALMHGASGGVLIAWHSTGGRHAHRIKFKLRLKLG
ncbi:hypothetical protein F4604DRAFT_1979254 [Suillus subluteus]|nr:hypothetical protein F4604DRAFT_1979254 [Suillus subluteus]